MEDMLRLELMQNIQVIVLMYRSLDGLVIRKLGMGPR